MALQLASGHTSVASSTGAGQLDTFCSVHSPTGWQRQGIVMLAWLGTPPIQPAAALPTISVLRAHQPLSQLCRHGVDRLQMQSATMPWRGA